MTEVDSGERLDYVRRRVREVREQIAAAAVAAGRSPESVTLIGITKTWPATDVEALALSGVLDVGENKAQELLAKQAELTRSDLTWHFVGQLQRNKARHVAQHAQWIHSLDRAALIQPLAHAAEEAGVRLNCLVQVNLDPAPAAGRGGVQPDEAMNLAELVAQSPALSLSGVMGVASRDMSAERSFTLLKESHDRMLSSFPGATAMSAGMSMDFPTAIAAGATHVRLGAALLGQRSYVR